MNCTKNYFKIFIGVAVLILVIVVFFFAQRSDTLETGTLKNWRAATIERRISAVQIMTGATENIDILVACIDKMATLPDSGEMAVRDAASLCHTGIKVKPSL